MHLQQLIGNDSAKAFLQGKSKELKVLLFSGPEGVGKRSFAKAFLQDKWGPPHAWKIENELHPDVRYVLPDGKTRMHSIASLKEMIEEAGIAPFEAQEKVFIIEEADRMLPTSGNLLLKTLEEPPPRVLFILLTAHEEEILPTLLSRMVKVCFSRIEDSVITASLLQKGIAQDRVQEVLKKASGSFSKALALVEKEEDSIRELFTEILNRCFLKKTSINLVEDLDKLNKLIEKKEEEAISQVMDSLFEDLLLHLSDRHYKNIETGSIHVSHLPSLEQGMDLVDKARLAVQRHSKPKVVLEHLFQQLFLKSAKLSG